MTDLIIRDLHPETLRRLRLRAAERGRSPEAEARAILERILGGAADEFWAKAAELRARTRGRRHTDSAELIRGDRDRRSGVCD